MFKNFILCPFRVYLPVLSVHGPDIQVDFDVEIKDEGENPEVYLSQFYLKNSNGKYIISATNEAMTIVDKRKHFTFWSSVALDTKNIRDYSIEIYLRSNFPDYYYDVYYEVNDPNSIELCAVNSYGALSPERYAKTVINHNEEVTAANKRYKKLEEHSQVLLDQHSALIEHNKSLETQNTVLKVEYEDLEASYTDLQKSLDLYRRLYSEEVIKNDSLLKEITAIRKKKDDAKKRKLSGKRYEETKAFKDAINASRRPVFPDNNHNQ